MKRIITATVICALLASQVFAVGRRKAAYVGGTIASLNQHKGVSEGEMIFDDPKVFIFKVKGQSVDVPYDRISGLEYQNTRHLRTGFATGTMLASYVGVAAATSLVAFAIFPAALIAIPFVKHKKKRHFLTVMYKDANDQSHAMVLELGKEIEKVARAVLSARSGREIKVIVEGDSTVGRTESDRARD
ncbi:MAG: hypothetical protein ACREEM_51225 [Blastocatellia bacterium]